MKKSVFAIVVIIFLIIIALISASLARAVYVPDIHTFDPDVDYMAKMVEAAEDGSQWALAMGQIYEQLRNDKIDVLGLNYEKTDYFKNGDAKKVWESISEYLSPTPECELIYVGDYYITGYDICYECCGKTDGITASGTYATAGRTAAAGYEFDFGERIWIEGLGERTVEDRGGAIGGGRIDVLCENHNVCYSITGWYPVYRIVEG